MQSHWPPEPGHQGVCLLDESCKDQGIRHVDELLLGRRCHLEGGRGRGRRWLLLASPSFHGGSSGPLGMCYLRADPRAVDFKDCTQTSLGKDQEMSISFCGFCICAVCVCGGGGPQWILASPRTTPSLFAVVLWVLWTRALLAFRARGPLDGSLKSWGFKCWVHPWLLGGSWPLPGVPPDCCRCSGWGFQEESCHFPTCFDVDFFSHLPEVPAV